MAEFVSSQVEFWNRYVEKNQRHTNTLPAPRGTTSEGGSADNLYSGGYFKIGPDEPLLPADTARLVPQERAAMLKQRASDVARRFAM